MVSIIISASVSAFFFVLALYSFRMESREDISRRLLTYAGGERKSAGNDGKGVLFGGLFRKRKEGEIELTTRRDGWHSRLRTELSRAGIPLRPEEYLILSAVSGLLFSLLLVALTKNVATVPLGFMAGGVVMPFIIIRREKIKRTAMFNQQLGDALSTMSNSLRVGFSLFQAMKSLSEEMSPPLAVEFTRALQEINLGARVDDALQNMCDRIKSDDLELVVMAIIIQRQVGGNLSEVLDNIAHTIRERIKVQREVKTLTAQGRISGLIIGLLPVFLAGILYMINPSYILILFTHPLGIGMVTVGLISQAVGILLIRKIVDIKW